SFRAPLDGYTLPMFGGVVMRIHSFGGAHLAIAVGLFAATGSGQQPAPVGYDDTPMQPNGKWRIHDANRPQPTVVTAPPALATPTPPPSDATVLIGTKDDLGAWQMADGSPATWPMKNGVAETGKGIIRTKAQFTDF